MERWVGLGGMVVLLGLVYASSTNRRAVQWRPVIVGLALQFVLGILLLKVPVTARAFSRLAEGVAAFLALSDHGARMIFGGLVDTEQFGFMIAVKVVPTIIFFSAFISILYYLGIVPFVVNLLARLMRLTMHTSGSETLSCAGNIFVGQTEAPLLIRPYLERMTLSELHAVMCGGFATIAGGVLAAYIGMGISPRHLIIASVMSAPAALAIAKLSAPETEHSETAGDADLPKISVGENLLDAATRGTTDGLKLALNVAAMLIAFVALIAVVDWALGGIDALVDGRWLGGAAFPRGGGEEFAGIVPGSLRTLFGTLLAPVAFLFGIPWSDASQIGHLLGVKISLNEFVAYLELRSLIEAGAISERSVAIATYALCGFANFGSIGIQIGGISALAPGRRADLARLALRAMLCGAAASFTTAMIAGVLL